MKHANSLEKPSNFFIFSRYFYLGSFTMEFHIPSFSEFSLKCMTFSSYPQLFVVLIAVLEKNLFRYRHSTNCGFKMMWWSHNIFPSRLLQVALERQTLLRGATKAGENFIGRDYKVGWCEIVSGAGRQKNRKIEFFHYEILNHLSSVEACQINF